MRLKWFLILVLLALLPLAVHAATITVGPGGYDYASIQEAVDAAKPCDTIEVYGGIYNENVNVSKCLTLRGIGMPVVDAGGSGSAITLSADGIALEGFAERNSSRGWGRLGAGIMVTSKNNTIGSNDACNNEYGIYLSYSENNNISGNNASNNNDGICLFYSSNNTLYDNSACNNEDDGIFLKGSGGNIMQNNHMSSNYYNFGADGDNDIDASNLVDGKPIYYLVGESDTIIDSSSNAGAVFCTKCQNITVKELDISNNSFGIYFYNSSNSRIMNNQISNCEFGISISHSSDNIITGNNAICNVQGIQLRFADNNTILGNNASDNDGGIFLYDSCNNTMRKNLMSDNYYNFLAVGDNDIDASNLVDGKPVCYLVGASDIVIDPSSNAGVVCLISCQNVTVKGMTLTNNTFGVCLSDTSNSRIENNLISSNEHGIWLKTSINSTISGNTVVNNSGGGIHLFYSDGNRVLGNNASNNWEGISLFNSNNNTISNNSAGHNDEDGISIEGSSNNTLVDNNVNSNGDGGICLRWSSSGNLLYGNDLVDNGGDGDAYDDGHNQWDNGTAGNYYSDFDCTDDDGNGFCDSRYMIPGGKSVDEHPLALACRR